MAKHQEIGIVRHAGRVVLGLFLLFAGIGHLTFGRREFQAQVPNWLKMDKDLVVLLSGYVEIALALLILFYGHRNKKIPWLLALFFVAIFPGNWSQYVNQRDGFGLNTDAARLLRLFFQPVLILWALWSMGAIGPKRKPRETVLTTDSFPLKLK
ncbi:hypothetical protein PQ465_12950 [Sphingobacterium oryzagri]|uniref:DoxX family membrane protein n=1 Tax=Sphingobacterium oryzagri TaxID=3025669 RepID=A0ABY7WFP9_9SPHI|nr:hypothetical protein [Sphingobacterium sp. KACC 22765]WDF67213.1 hypothetical protein PQ465_12950 [Sphingobacterium sp. KACC 22765]